MLLTHPYQSHQSYAEIKEREGARVREWREEDDVSSIDGGNDIVML